MSFSKQIKEELSKMNNLAHKEYVQAELIGYLLSNNTTIVKGKIRYSTQNEYNINRFHKLLINLNIDYNIQLQGKVYSISFKKMESDMMDYIEDKVQIKKEVFSYIQTKGKEEILKSFVRGAFLGGGSLNDPNHTYHLEMLFSTEQNAEFILQILLTFGVESKTLQRKNCTSIYMKEAEEISNFLALLGANKAVLDFEEIRVVRDTRNNVNRLVNCETANLNKTVNAAVEQMQQIEYLIKQKKFDELADNLKEIAYLRKENPDASLTQLGQLLKDPIGKSGVNHRLKKICEIAEELRKSNGESKYER